VNGVRKNIMLAIAGIVFLAGCGDQGNKASNVPVTPKWKGAPYRIAFDTATAKPNPAGITIPVIKYTANPDALERRITLVVRFDTSGARQKQDDEQPVMDQMIMGPVDISGAEGAISGDYMNESDKGLAKILGSYCMKGRVKIQVALARSSINPRAGDAEVNAKRLSDWLPIELVFKNPHPAC
jgi:hypothetical protein